MPSPLWGGLGRGVMSKRLRKGKLNWRSKKANHGAKPGKG